MSFVYADAPKAGADPKAAALSAQEHEADSTEGLRPFEHIIDEILPIAVTNVRDDSQVGCGGH